MAFARPHPRPDREQRIAERAARNAAQAQTCLPRRAAVVGGGTVGPAPKECAVESEAYRRLVAAMPCKHCGIAGYSQAAHPNTGKGAGIKTDDRRCFPLCTVHPVAGGYVQGCHERFDQGALYAKAIRREIEEAWGADTRRAIEAAGQWPEGLEKMA